LIVSHASVDPRFMDHPGLKLHGIESYIAVPLNRRDGTYFGTLCALDPLPADLNEDGLQIFHLLASLIAFELEAEDSERRARAVAQQLAAQARELARLEERERIAMDLHDGVIQSLYSIVLGLGAEEFSDEPNERAQAPSQTIARLNDLIHEIRNNIFSLHVRDLGEAGLRGGIEHLAEELRVGTLVNARVAVDSGIEEGINSDALRSLLYIAREATSNVIRHSGATSVTLSLKRVAEHLEMSIRDNGAGIKAGDLPHIFDIFFQGEVPANVQHGGLGIGLPVVKNLVELHAATIEVHSDGEGAGAGLLLFARPNICLPVFSALCSSTKCVGGIRTTKREPRPGLTLDYDKAGRLVSIELLDASEQIQRPQSVEFALAGGP